MCAPDPKDSTSGTTDGGDAESTDSTRRSFLNYDALAASALVIGTADASTWAFQNETYGENQREELVLVSIDDYRPETTVDVVDRLPAPLTADLLVTPDGESVRVATQPDEYTGYVVRSRASGDVVDTTTLVSRADGSRPTVDTSSPRTHRCSAAS